MKSRRQTKAAKNSRRANSLNQVLEKSEGVKDTMEQCADELSSVNEGLKQELKDGESLPGIENALEQSEAVESKVLNASVELASVNQVLKEEVEERRLLEDQLTTVTSQGDEARHASLHDPLTGLPNRALFNDRLEHGLAQAKRHDFSLAVMFIDLDDFKTINDSYGHDVGDLVLQTIASRLRDNTRDDDTVCRYGGDEFLYILMEMQSERDIVAIAKKVIRTVQVPCAIQLRDISISLSVRASIGIAIFPQDGVTADTLLDNADKAMYRAKRGKSGHAFAIDLSSAADGSGSRADEK